MRGVAARTRPMRLRALLFLAVLNLAALQTAPASPHEAGEADLQGVGVDERLGERVPGELSFTDADGRAVRVAEYFTGQPVILVLTYYSCPTLCPVVFRNLAAAAGRLGDLKLGRDYRIVAVSIDPQESPSRAREKSSLTYARLGSMLDAGATPQGSWPFLMGEPQPIRDLSRALGIGYRKEQQEYAHPNVLVVATPDRRISRYLYGVEHRPQDLRLALLEASNGRIGSSFLVNRALLYCFHYDPVGKKYVLFASRLMTAVMLLVLALTVALLLVLWRGERKRGPA